MAYKSNANEAVDQDLRNALIRANIALLQREIREKKDWYTTRRVVVRKRNGRIHLSRLGSRQQQPHHQDYTAIDFDDDSQTSNSFTLIDEPLTTRSASSSFSSTTSSNFA
ncbi:uncharacterized protein F4822DRAFT_106822 [Hypoxylon trugodes]|uniref:uncharacterized protein n=1 Tax=Hypoxylon trugodes TaxID=326681 RepID=UPI00219E6ED5|nr:uncharacterized protein F4822DRAFT_106822 [Hypoxylon trugodes]KAI1391842.1 hypothetical protein F4822DRAFT_106822 [Hypoxylon trugodes]